eukprot:UN23188
MTNMMDKHEAQLKARDDGIQTLRDANRLLEKELENSNSALILNKKNYDELTEKNQNDIRELTIKTTEELNQLKKKKQNELEKKDNIIISKTQELIQKQNELDGKILELREVAKKDVKINNEKDNIIKELNRKTQELERDITCLKDEITNKQKRIDELEHDKNNEKDRQRLLDATSIENMNNVDERIDNLREGYDKHIL